MDSKFGPDVDPETGRLVALTALRAWTRRRDRMPEQRAELMAAAWRAGERNVRELARIAEVSRQTVYDDLRGQGVDPKSDRAAVVDRPRYAPLNHGQIAELAEYMGGVLLPSMLVSQPEPLADAAWMAHKALRALTRLLDPATVDLDRPGLLEGIADYADAMRQAAHRQWAAESADAELARHTIDAAVTQFGDQAITEQAVLTMTLPDGMSQVQVTLSSAGHRDPEPEGWARWTSDSPLPLDSINGYRHLEINSLLMGLGDLVTRALHPDLLEEL